MPDDPWKELVRVLEAPAPTLLEGQLELFDCEEPTMNKVENNLPHCDRCSAPIMPGQKRCPNCGQPVKP
jgi:hypothetical protein